MARAHRRGALLHRARAPRQADDPAVRPRARPGVGRRAAARGASSGCSSSSRGWRRRGPTDLRTSFKEFAARPRQLGLTVIISDFLDPGGFDAGIKILRTLGHDVFVVHITSEHDRNPGRVRRGALRRQRKPASCARSRSRRGSPSAYVKAWDAHADGARTLLRPLRRRLRPRRRRAAVRGHRPQGVPAGTVRRVTFGADGGVARLAAARGRGSAGGRAVPDQAPAAAAAHPVARCSGRRVLDECGSRRCGNGSAAPSR